MAAPDLLDPESTRDDVLVERVGKGDQEAFETLYGRYYPRVFRFVSRRLRNRADVEETVQEVFFAVFSSMGSFRGEAPFVAWVLGLTRRTIAARFKKKRHTTVSLDGAEEPEGVDPLIPGFHREATPLENYECRERMEQLEHAASEQLSPDQWRLFELYHLKHESIRSIARATSRSEDAVKSNLYRARKLLLAR